jgi:hypothetical protein
MRKNLFLLIPMLTIFFLSACAQKKLTKTEQKAPEAVRPAITYIMMERTPCFGRCPYYALELKSDGMARYYGYKFTEHQGIYEIGIGIPQASHLFKTLESYRPDTCQDIYEMMIADLPGINYTITYDNDETKSIRNANFGPGFLQDFARKMDEMMQVDDSWRIIADTAIRN